VGEAKGKAGQGRAAGTVNVRLAGMTPAVCCPGAGQRQHDEGGDLASDCELSSIDYRMVKCGAALSDASLPCCGLVLVVLLLLLLLLLARAGGISKRCLQSNGNAVPALWPHGGIELGRQVSVACSEL
jgi:hypothetical protein